MHRAHDIPGGWTLGNIETGATICTNACRRTFDAVYHRSSTNIYDLLAGANCIVVAVAYRLAPEDPYPAAVDDAVEALLWVYKKGAALIGANPSKIAVGGGSR